MGGQPATALRQGLGMGEHLGDFLQGAAAEQGMTDRKHHGPPNADLGIRPQGIEAGRHPAFNRVLDGNHSRITSPVCHMLHHRSQAHTRQQFGVVEAFQLHQCPGGPLPIGAVGTEKCHRDRHRQANTHSIGSCRVGQRSCFWLSVPARP